MTKARHVQEETLSEPCTHYDLWAGIDRKIENAGFHFNGMVKALRSPERSPYTVAALIGRNWHTAFYAHLDAFLSAARSVPELIRCCFGVDDSSKMKAWFEALDREERERRRDFEAKFKADYDAFRALPLGTARHISEHRTGFPPVTAMVSGRFGIYLGGPTKPIPTSETRELPPEYAGMEKPIAVQPSWRDFHIDGKPLFETCRDYLDRARTLATQARALAEEVHGDSELTWPSSDM
jgi:hypothetical protein